MTRKLTGFLSLLLMLCTVQTTYAQSLTEKTGIRIYEHHSSSINGGAEFGNSANPYKSGYDFVNHKYVNSFNMSTFTAYSSSSPVPATIDMVEHNGPFTMGGNFGFTAGNSTIWEQMGPPYIRGNELTMYVEAPSGFDYAALNDLNQIVTAYSAGTKSLAIQSVQENTVYLARIRNSGTYVAIKVTKVKNYSGTTVDDVYFDFDYKYGSLVTGIENMVAATAEGMKVMQSAGNIRLYVPATARCHATAASLMSTDGKQISFSGTNPGSYSLETRMLPAGIYVLCVRFSDGTLSSRKLFVQGVE